MGQANDMYEASYYLNKSMIYLPLTMKSRKTTKTLPETGASANAHDMKEENAKEAVEPALYLTLTEKERTEMSKLKG